MMIVDLQIVLDIINYFFTLKMELLSSMLNIVKNVSDTDREFKLLRQKLVFNLKKGDATLHQYKKQAYYQSWIGEHLERRLKDARQKLQELDILLSSKGEGISFKDKFKLSLPFNNQRDKINQIIDDLKNAIDQVLNNNIPINETGMKKKLDLEKAAAKKKVEMAEEEEKERQIDNEIDELYEMGPTIQQNNAFEFAQEYTKNHTVQVNIETFGNQNILKVLEPQNRRVRVEHTCERVSKESGIELFKLGRKNFKPEYKVLKQVYPDIDKISKDAHFAIKWMRAIHLDKSQISEASNKKSHNIQQQSQKKEEADQFFSVPEVQHVEIENGQVILQKEKRSLYKKRGQGWVKVDEEWFEVSNGEEVAICLGKQQIPELFFKITYEWK